MGVCFTENQEKRSPGSGSSDGKKREMGGRYEEAKEEQLIYQSVGKNPTIREVNGIG